MLHWFCNSGNLHKCQRWGYCLGKEEWAGRVQEQLQIPCSAEFSTVYWLIPLSFEVKVPFKKKKICLILFYEFSLNLCRVLWILVFSKSVFSSISDLKGEVPQSQAPGKFRHRLNFIINEKNFPEASVNFCRTGKQKCWSDLFRLFWKVEKLSFSTKTLKLSSGKPTQKEITVVYVVKKRV